MTASVACLMGAGRVFAVDRLPDRMEVARDQGAEVINFDEDDPVVTLRNLTGGIGVDRAADAAGVDAECPPSGPGRKAARTNADRFEQEIREVAPETHPDGDFWIPGGAPSQVVDWAVQSLAKAGTLSIIGVYPLTDRSYPLGMAMNRNLTLRMGNCHHRKYTPSLLELVRTGAADPEKILTRRQPMEAAIEAYQAFDLRQPGWIKVELKPRASAERGAA